MIYDVAIIGGGIAGLALSIDLSKRGYSVAVIEKGIYPKHKVCGEYISMESHDYLQAICPELKTINVPYINNFSFSSIGNSIFRTRLQQGGFGISRFALEKMLYEEALKNGAVFFLKSKAHRVESAGNTYKIQSVGQSIRCRLVCNSSGRRSNIEQDKIPNATNYVGVKYHIKVERDASLIEIHNFPGGYCGVSNIEDDKACLCYLINSTKIKEAGNSIKKVEKQILFQNKHLKSLFNRAEFIFNEPLTVSGINFAIKKPTTGISFFLGDAAGSIAPITGNGMSIGLRSACMLARMVDDYFKGSIDKVRLFRYYDEFWKKEFSGRIKISRYFQKLSEYPTLSKITINVFNAIPGVAEKLIGFTHGKPFSSG